MAICSIAIVWAVHLMGAVDTGAVNATKPPEVPTVAVLNLESNAGAKEQAPALSALIASRLSESPRLRVVSQSDIATSIGLERERQLLSSGTCSSSNECLVELSGAVGARFVVTGRVDRFGEKYLLTATLFDSQKGQSL